MVCLAVGACTDVTETEEADPDPLCEPACAAIADCLAVPVSECVSSCKAAGPSCATEYNGWLDCLVQADVLPTCGLPSECAGPLAAWVDCRSRPEDAVSHAGDTTSCEGGGELADRPYQAACDVATAECTCSVADQPVGTCTESNPAELCDPKEGCCATLLFVAAP